MDSNDAEANSLIQEFDQEVDKRCKMIKSSAENTSDNMMNALQLILGSIPECVRKMPLKALVQNFNGDITAASAYFAPSSACCSPTRSSPKMRKGGKRNLPLAQTMSLSDLLKQQSAYAAGLPPPVPKSPTKASSRVGTPTKSSSRTGTPTKTYSRSPTGKVQRGSPRTPTKKFF